MSAIAPLRGRRPMREWVAAARGDGRPAMAGTLAFTAGLAGFAENVARGGCPFAGTGEETLARRWREGWDTASRRAADPAAPRYAGPPPPPDWPPPAAAREMAVKEKVQAAIAARREDDDA